jgi:esterase/lipase superfamily enzyme
MYELGGDSGGYTAPNDFPLISTQNHFKTPTFGNIRLKDEYKRTGYEQIGVWENPTNVNDICVFIHGVSTSKSEAKNGAYTLKQAFDKHGYDCFVVGFTWQSEAGIWWRPTQLAHLNGVKLAQWIIDRQEKTNNRIRIVAQSLGALITLEALAELYNRNEQVGRSTRPVESVTLLGAAADANAPIINYSDPIGTMTHRTDNFYKRNDQVLGIVTLLERNEQLGRTGLSSSEGPPESYRDHDVTYEVTDHNSYQQPGEGCISEVLKTYGH